MALSFFLSFRENPVSPPSGGSGRLPTVYEQKEEKEGRESSAGVFSPVRAGKSFPVRVRVAKYKLRGVRKKGERAFLLLFPAEFKWESTDGVVVARFT